VYLSIVENDKAVNIFIRNIDMICKIVMTVNSFIVRFFLQMSII
jgi:hypothetical protein